MRTVLSHEEEGISSFSLKVASAGFVLLIPFSAACRILVRRLAGTQKNALRVFSLLFLLFPAVFLPDHSWAKSMVLFNPSGVRSEGIFVDDKLLESIEIQNALIPPSLGNFPHTRTEILEIKRDAWEEVNALFLARGWTDGLPVVPPTEARVNSMLQGTDLSGDFEVALLEPMYGLATVEKIAVNAVMAGCEPAHLPVLIAAVEAAADRNVDLRGMGTTTNPDAVLLIVSGPVVKDLQINAGGNVFGRGSKANLSLSRALHLILYNIGGSRPSLTDMSTLGQPGEIAMFLAENINASPWPSINTIMGHSAQASVVTVAPVEGYSGIVGIGFDAPSFLKIVANALKGQDRTERKSIILVVAQDTAAMLHNAGWDRERITAFIKDQARIPLEEAQELFGANRSRYRVIAERIPENAPQETLIPRPYLEDIFILVAGGAGEKSMLLPCWSAGRPVSREIRFPHHWINLLAPTP
jgi:hypothetical protein